MEITTTSRKFKLTPELKEMAEKKLGKLSRFGRFCCEQKFTPSKVIFVS